MKRKVKVVYMPTLNPERATDLRFFVPYASSYITEIVASCGFSVNFIDLNRWYWTLDNFLFINNRELLEFIKHDKITVNLRELINRIKKEFDIGKDSYTIYLLAKDYFSFELTDKSLLMLITIAKYIKDSGRNNIIILGGSHSKKEFMKQVISNFNCVDYAFYNEIWSKPNYDDLIECLTEIDSDVPSVESDRNYFYRSSNGCIKDYHPRDLEIYEGKFVNPSPKYDYTNTNYNFTLGDICDKQFLELYSIPSNKIIEGIVTVKFTNGCVNKCAYCKGSRLKPQIEPIDRVIDYIEFLYKEKGVKHFFFLNRELNMIPEYFRTFCKELIRKKLQIKWTDSFGFENLEPDDVGLIKDAGCIQVVVGIDTTSPKISFMMGRNTDINHMEKILSILHDKGIWVRGNIIVGFPYQNFKDIDDDILFLSHNQEFIQHLNVSEFKLFPHTLCGDFPDKYGLRTLNNTIEMQKLLQQDNPNMNYFSYIYEETKGRNLSEINNFTKQAFERMISLRNATKDTLSACLPLIFLLYETYDNKSQILDFISSYSRYLMNNKKVNNKALK